MDKMQGGHITPLEVDACQYDTLPVETTCDMFETISCLDSADVSIKNQKETPFTLVKRIHPQNSEEKTNTLVEFRDPYLIRRISDKVDVIL